MTVHVREHFRRTGVAAHTHGDDHREPVYIRVAHLHLAHVQPDPRLDADALTGLDHRPRGTDGEARHREHREHAVAGHLHDAPTMGLRPFHDVAFVAFEQFAPTRVVNRGSDFGRVDDVGEHDGHEPMVDGWRWAHTGDERFELDEHRLGVLEQNAWSVPSNSTNRAPGIPAARKRPCSTPIATLARPCITTVGTVTRPSNSRTSSCCAMRVTIMAWARLACCMRM